MVIKIFAVDTAEELRSVMKILDPKGAKLAESAQSEYLSDYLKRLNEDSEENTLERAIMLAEGFVDDFLPFTYHDVGCGEKRTYREAFRQWASENDIEFKQEKFPGNFRFQGMVFRPFRIDENGKKILAQYPEEVELSQCFS